MACCSSLPMSPTPWPGRELLIGGGMPGLAGAECGFNGKPYRDDAVPARKAVRIANRTAGNAGAVHQDIEPAIGGTAFAIKSIHSTSLVTSIFAAIASRPSARMSAPTRSESLPRTVEHGRQIEPAQPITLR
jgi:hypothetical protein